MNVAKLPKVELHCHIDGIVSASMTADILKKYPHFPLQPDDFQDRDDVNDYETFWKWYEVIKPLPKNIVAYYPIVEQYIAHLKAQNVRYFEIMLNSGQLPEDIPEAIDKVRAMRQWLNEQENGEIQVEIIIVFGRNKTVERVAELGEKIIVLYDAGLICGVGIAGPEPNNPIKPFHKTFAKFHEAGMGIEVHAGEWVGTESVWDALNYGFPTRIGHGVSLFQDPKLIELFQDKQIHIEMCPTSNLKTGSIATIEEHPIRRALDLGLNFSVNTDDPGPFASSMNSEYELLATSFGFTEADFETVYRNSLDARFQKALRVEV